MPFDETKAADIEMIIVTDDHAHAQSIRDSLSHGRYRYAITHIGDLASLRSDFDATVEGARGKRPAIVFLDCAFLNGDTETYAARVLELRRTMAIECVATRPPLDPRRRMRLRMLGAALFDAQVGTLDAIPLH